MAKAFAQQDATDSRSDDESQDIAQAENEIAAEGNQRIGKDDPSSSVGQRFANDSESSAASDEEPLTGFAGTLGANEVRHWYGEAWCRDDALVLNLPVFKPCGDMFKRLLLREMRMYECELYCRETWLEKATDKIYTLEKLPWNKLPPLLKKEEVGEAFDKGDYICRGGAWDAKLVVVLEGSVEKLIGDSVSGGRCIVRTLTRGDCEGLVEFLGAGSDQRCCALRAAEDGTRIRLIDRDGVQRLCAMKVSDSLDSDAENENNKSNAENSLMFPKEAEYFRELALDRIDSIPHKSSRSLLTWAPGSDGAADTFLLRRHKELEEKLEVEHHKTKFFLIGSTVKIGSFGVGTVETKKIIGVEGNMLELDSPLCHNHGEGEEVKKDALDFLSLPGQTFFYIDDSLGMTQAGPLPEGLEDRYYLDGETVLKRGVPGDCAILILRGMVEAEVPEGCENNCLHCATVLETAGVDVSKERSWLGDYKPEPSPAAFSLHRISESSEVTLSSAKARKCGWSAKQKPPTPSPEPVLPRAVLGTGTVIGQLSVLGMPVVLAGTIRAKGPCVVVILHRHALLEALDGYQELDLFQPSGIDEVEQEMILLRPCVDPNLRPDQGPATGPPPPRESCLSMAKAATMSAWRADGGLFSKRAGADALRWVLIHAINDSVLFKDWLDDAHPRLIKAFMDAWEPRYLLANEVVVVDEEPDANFLSVVIHGTFVVTLEGCQIDEVGQGAVLGGAQLLGLADWTRTVKVHPKQNGEAMIQLLRRDRLLEVLSGHPVVMEKLRNAERQLKEAKDADWRIISRVPAFLSIANKPFLSRLHKDADILFYCAGDTIAKTGDPSASMIVVLAGTCRSEQPQTLFCLELKKGDWTFMNNILGNDQVRKHDVIAVTHTMVLILHRHALMNALTDFPTSRTGILENEKWRCGLPQINDLRCFANVPQHVIAELSDSAALQFCKEHSVILAPGEDVPSDSLIVILRGEAVVSIMGIEVRTLKAGETIGLMRYLKLPVLPSNCTITAKVACDLIRIPQRPMDEVELDDLYEEDLRPWMEAKSTFAGGPVLDQWGFETEHGGILAADCVVKSDVFSPCSPDFVSQMPSLVEDRIFYLGEKLCYAGEPGDCMFFVQSGRVRLQMIGVDDEMVEPGGCIGDLACIGIIDSQLATATAETHVWVRVLYRSLLRRSLSAFDGEERNLKGPRVRRSEGIFDD